MRSADQDLETLGLVATLACEKAAALRTLQAERLQWGTEAARLRAENANLHEEIEALREELRSRTSPG